MGLGVRELFDNNIKVHFAGSDGGEIFYAALLAAQTKYRLFSCYKYILKCRPDDDFRLPADHVIRVQDTVNRHVIQDSGLFTLMFGAGKGQMQTLESLTEWQHHHEPDLGHGDLCGHQLRLRSGLGAYPRGPDAAYRYHHRAVSSESLSGAVGYSLFLFLHKKCRPPLTASCSVRSVFRLPV